MVNAGRLHRLARVLREIALTATAQPGEDPTSVSVLAIVEDVAHHEATTVGQIAERTGLAQSMVSKTVAELRTANVLVSEPDPSDGRRALISVHRQARTDIFRARASRSIAPAVRAHLVDGTDADVERILLLLDELAERIIR